jgi:hypothetical protein
MVKTTKVISVSIDIHLAETIETRRGLIPRSSYVEMLIKKGMNANVGILHEVENAAVERS